MPNYLKLLENLEQVDSFCRKAEESLVPIAKLKQVDAYMLGLLQSLRVTLNEAKKAAKTAARVQKSSPPKKSIFRLT